MTWLQNTKHGLKVERHPPGQPIPIANSVRKVQIEPQAGTELMNDASFEDEFERRTVERAPRNRGALLRITGLNDFFALTVRDTSDCGVGVRLHIDLPLLPINFELSEDGFQTAKQCRLVWREGNFLGAEFVDQVGKK